MNPILDKTPVQRSVLTLGATMGLIGCTLLSGADNLSVGKARIWEWMFFTGEIDPSKSNIRAGIIAVWVGTQADLNVRASVWLHCQRLASRIEKLLATGPGTPSNIDGVGPATMGFVGPISFQDVQDARNS